MILVSILHGTRCLIIANTLPESVLGGAKKSGFCLSISKSCGPIIVAPREPRTAWGSVFVSELHSTPLGSSLAYGTVGVASGTSMVEDGLCAPADGTIELLAADKTGTPVEIEDRALLLRLDAELSAEGVADRVTIDDEGWVSDVDAILGPLLAGAALTTVAKSMAQMTVLRKLLDIATLRRTGLLVSRH